MRFVRLFTRTRLMAQQQQPHIHTNIDVANIRKPYKALHEYFDVEHLVAKEPIGQFKKWFEEAAQHVEEPNAFCLATATKDGIPSNRFLLMKGFDEKGFKFFTNYDSRKGHDLEENPHAAMCFYWSVMSRSVRIEGPVEKLPAEEANEYFQSRPADSQISGAISPQSQPIPNREFLLNQRQHYIDNQIKAVKPERWGGFRLVPNMIEFYQGQSNRLSDRIQFRRVKDDTPIDSSVTHRGEFGWVYERLAP